MAVTPIAGLPEQPNIVGPHFRIGGLGKYYNPRNVNGQQFNKPAVNHAVTRGLNDLTKAKYFRHAGFNAALRYTLGLPQVPSHVNDYINARTTSRTRVTGINPGSLEAEHRPWLQE